MNILREILADQGHTLVLGVISAQAKKRADLIEHCEQLRTANSQLRRLYKELEDDLAVAASVQRHLEPRPLVWGRVRVETFSQPARTVGGDFGVVCPLDDRHLNLLVCDVSGHGISAALAASRVFSEASAHLATNTFPDHFDWPCFSITYKGDKVAKTLRGADGNQPGVTKQQEGRS